MLSTFFECKVTQAGPIETGEIMIMLQSLDVDYPDIPEKPTENDKRYRWFSPVPEARKEMLAVALVAHTSGFAVSARIQDPQRAYDSKIERLYITERKG